LIISIDAFSCIAPLQKEEKDFEQSIKVSFGGQNLKGWGFFSKQIACQTNIGVRLAVCVFGFTYILTIQKSQAPNQTHGLNAHPHRGIATLTYLLSGSHQHFDSCNNDGTVHEEAPPG